MFLNFLLASSVSISVFATNLSHPISLVSFILTQTLLVCLMSSLLSQTPWIALILFLVFIGAVMILFVYITSLASNEGFSLTYSELTMMSFMTLLLFSIIYPLIINSHPSYFNINLSNFTTKMYSHQMMPIMIISIIYLLLSLLMIVEIIKLNNAPLRASHHPNLP